jgi:quinoprotein glucose dehydrogenase
MSGRPRGPAAALSIAALCGVMLLWGAARVVSQASLSEWRVYGGPGQTRYSPLNHITRSNVRNLQVAWTFDSGEQGGLQTSPIVVNGVLYALTPTHKVVALDAATGARRWIFDSGIVGRGPNRGVMYWTDGARGRIFTGQDTYIYALDALTGKPIAEFGANGRIDLRDGLGRDPDAQSVLLTTPGVIYQDLMIVGGRVSENLPASPGDIRAYDVRTGAVKWTFHTIPHPGEQGYETWPRDAWTYTGGANSWSGMAVDERRGIVFAPTGSAASDFYGANRHGDNLYANSLIALDARTGRRLWHFQGVHHDMWDRDFPSPPSLVTVRRGRQTTDAVAVATKHGQVFVFDRATGKSLFPLKSRAYPASDVAGEQASATQVLPEKPAPFARQLLTESMLTTRTADAHRAAVDAFRGLRSEGQFIPFSVGRETVVLPGFDGGAEWGGSAFDPASGNLYVNANEMAWLARLAPNETGTGGRDIYLRECAVCHRDDLKGAPPEIPSLTGVAGRRQLGAITTLIRQGAGRMPSFPGLSGDAVSAVVEYLRTGESVNAGETAKSPIAMKYRFTGFKKFLDADGYPAIAPPWGTLNAINLNTGDYAWKVPLGEYPELAAGGMKNTGSENYGGPIVTAGGLVFIGASNFDRKFRAFDSRTGELLWETMLPYSGNATPITYEAGGRQFVVIAAGGGRNRPGTPQISGGTYVAFALPQ